MLSPRDAFVGFAAAGSLLVGCGNDAPSAAEVPPFVPFEDRSQEIIRIRELRDAARLALSESQTYYEDVLTAIPDDDCEAAVRSFTPPSGANQHQELDVLEPFLKTMCDEVDADDVGDLREYYNGPMADRQTLLNTIEQSLAANVAAQMEDDRLR